MIFQLVVVVLALLVCVEDVVGNEAFGLRIFPGSAFDEFNGEPISLRIGYEGFMMNQLPPPSTQLVRVVFSTSDNVETEHVFVDETAAKTEDQLLLEGLQELVQVNEVINFFQNIFAQEETEQDEGAERREKEEIKEEILPEFHFGLRTMPRLRGFRTRPEHDGQGICLHSCRGVIETECQAEISREAPRKEMYKCLQKAAENPQVQIPLECRNTIDEIKKLDVDHESPTIRKSLTRIHHGPMPILKASPQLYEHREAKHHGHPHVGHKMRHHMGHYMGRSEELYETPTEEKSPKETLLQELREHHLLSENEEFYLQVSILVVLSLIWIIGTVQLVVRLCSREEEEEEEEEGDDSKVGYVAMPEK